MAQEKAIVVDGLKEFQAAARRSVDSELPKRLGQAHKDIGALVISRLRPAPDPSAIGTGAGAAVRPSASKREVLLRVGGAHRNANAPRQIWGKNRVGRVGVPAPPRPYIRGTVESHYDEIGEKYLQAIADAMRPAFHKTTP